MKRHDGYATKEGVGAECSRCGDWVLCGDEAGSIETGGNDGQPYEYVMVNGRTTRQDPVDGDHVVQLEWNVPSGGGTDPEFSFGF